MFALTRKRIHDQISKANRFLLLTDLRIDGDTIGSTLGMMHVLREMGKDVTVFSPMPIDPTLEFLPGVEMIRRDEQVFDEDEYDLVLIFDCSEDAYIKPLLPRLRNQPKLIVFDHHETNPMFGDINLVEKSAASTADVVWRFLKQHDYPINQEAAQCIMTGIITDTDTFSTSNTTPNSLEAAHELVKHGAKLQEIVRNTMMNKSMSALKLWGLAFERLHENKEFEAIATAITSTDVEKLGAKNDDLQGLSNFLNAMVEGAETVLVLYERNDGTVKGSLRARTRNVAEVAMRYGGGGHKLAAGFSVKNAFLKQKGDQWMIERRG